MSVTSENNQQTYLDTYLLKQDAVVGRAGESAVCFANTTDICPSWHARASDQSAINSWSGSYPDDWASVEFLVFAFFDEALALAHLPGRGWISQKRSCATFKMWQVRRIRRRIRI
jgi:hypothetical protein